MGGDSPALRPQEFAAIESMMERIKALAMAETQELVNLRRELHRHPEVSFQEDWTSTYLCDKLKELNLPYIRKGKRGIAVRISGDLPGPHIAFRADFDALPIQEETGLPYASQISGRMHACGHDAHSSILLALARTMAHNRDLLRGTVSFLFQDAEEIPPGGAAAMVEDGCLDGVDRIYALHVSEELDTGVIGIREGNYMAATYSFEVSFLGRGGHGSRPSQGDDTVSALASAITAINAIPSRFVPAHLGAVVAVCSVHGGTSYNALPAKCTLQGTVRTFEPETAELIRERIEICARSTAELYHTGHEFRFAAGYAPVVNNDVCCQVVRRAAELLGQDCVTLPPTTIAEDFSAYLQHVPGAFFRLGIRNPAMDAVYPLHSGKFRLDEAALPTALEMFWTIYLQETGQI